MAKQTTIANAITLKGVGIHTGEEVTMTFKPAQPTMAMLFNASIWKAARLSKHLLSMLQIPNEEQASKKRRKKDHPNK